MFCHQVRCVVPAGAEPHSEARSRLRRRAFPAPSPPARNGPSDCNYSCHRLSPGPGGPRGTASRPARPAAAAARVLADGVKAHGAPKSGSPFLSRCAPQMLPLKSVSVRKRMPREKASDTALFRPIENVATVRLDRLSSRLKSATSSRGPRCTSRESKTTASPAPLRIKSKGVSASGRCDGLHGSRSRDGVAVHARVPVAPGRHGQPALVVGVVLEVDGHRRHPPLVGGAFARPERRRLPETQTPCLRAELVVVFGGAARVLGFARGGGFFGPVGGHHSSATYGRDVAYKSKAS